MKLYIEQLHPIQWNKKAFDQLVLGKRTKGLVKALVEARISSERMEDVIEGKGKDSLCYCMEAQEPGRH